MVDCVSIENIQSSFPDIEITEVVENTETTNINPSQSTSLTHSFSPLLKILSDPRVNRMCDFKEIYNKSVLPENSTFQPCLSSKETNLLDLTQCIHLNLGSWDVFSYFSAFTAYFYESGLAESGGIVISTACLKPSLDFKMKTLEKMTQTPVKVQQKQHICAKLENCKVYTVKPKLSTFDGSITNFQKLEDECSIGTSNESIMNSVLDNFDHHTIKNSCAEDVKGTLLEINHNGWNLNSLGDDISRGRVLPGNKPSSSDDIMGPSLHVGKYKTIITLRKGTDNLGFISYLHHGKPVVWIVIPPKHAYKLETKLAKVCKTENSKCQGFILHKRLFVHPKQLKAWNIPYSIIIQPEYSYMVLSAGSYFEGFNLGFNVSESVHYSTRETFPQFKMDRYVCYCAEKSFFLLRDKVVCMYQPDRSDDFLEGNDIDVYPYSNVEHLAMNDKDRAANYASNHLLQLQKKETKCDRKRRKTMHFVK